MKSDKPEIKEKNIKDKIEVVFSGIAAPDSDFDSFICCPGTFFTLRG